MLSAGEMRHLTTCYLHGRLSRDTAGQKLQAYLDSIASGGESPASIRDRKAFASGPGRVFVGRRIEIMSGLDLRLTRTSGLTS